MPKDENGRGPGSTDSQPPDLRKEREQLLQSFPRGSRITEEFLEEHERLRRQLSTLETENAQLRAKVEADEAVRELLRKINELEREKSDLVSRFQQAEAVSSQFHERFAQVESEFADMANLFVASNQLHSTMSPRRVTRRIKEILVQLLGAERFCVYMANAERTELIPIASEGLAGEDLAPVPVARGPVGEALRTGSALVDEKHDPCEGTLARPAAVIPMIIDDAAVGVIAIFSTLSQKTRFKTIDFELFKLLGQHAAGALVSASLFVQAERKMPGLEAFLDLSV
jgi:vacuolar-type H+-ATPase subunit I/STV1